MNDLKYKQSPQNMCLPKPGFETSFFNKHPIPVQIKPSTTLRQKHIQRKDKTSSQSQNNVIYAV